MSSPLHKTAAGIVRELGIPAAGELVRTFEGPLTANLVAAFGPKLTAAVVDALGTGYTGEQAKPIDCLVASQFRQRPSLEMPT
jgi:hypothetical protein